MALAPSSVSSSSFNPFGAILGLTSALSGIAGLVGGYSGFKSANQEAALMEQQAILTQQETQRAAEQKAFQVTKFQKNQLRQYLNAGVMLEGTPLLMLEETRRLGQEEVDALMRRGQAQAELIRAQAKITRRAGRTSLFSSIFNAAGSGLETFMAGRRVGLFGGSGTAAYTPVYNPNYGAIPSYANIGGF